MLKTIRQQLDQIVGVAGKRVYADLRTGIQTAYLDLLLKGTINITVGATRVINKGSIFGAWDFLGVNAGGDDDVVMDGRCCRAAAEAYAPSALASTRLGGVGVAATALTEAARIWFGHPRQAIPTATYYREKNPRKQLRLFGQLRADGGQGGIVTGGTSTMSVAPTVDGIQYLDDLTDDPPDFIPTIWQDVLDISAANSNKTYKIETESYLRGILIQQESDQGEVGDIVNALALRASGRDIIGPNKARWDQLIRAQEHDLGGSVFVAGTSYGQGAYLFLDFEEGGRLSNIIPGTIPQLRFELDCQQSVQAGVTKSQLRFTFFGLSRTPGLVKPTEQIGYQV